MALHTCRGSRVVLYAIVSQVTTDISALQYIIVLQYLHITLVFVAINGRLSQVRPHTSTDELVYWTGAPRHYEGPPSIPTRKYRPVLLRDSKLNAEYKTSDDFYTASERVAVVDCRPYSWYSVSSLAFSRVLLPDTRSNKRFKAYRSNYCTSAPFGHCRCRPFCVLPHTEWLG